MVGQKDYSILAKSNFRLEEVIIIALFSRAIKSIEPKSSNSSSKSSSIGTNFWERCRKGEDTWASCTARIGVEVANEWSGDQRYPVFWKSRMGDPRKFSFSSRVGEGSEDKELNMFLSCFVILVFGLSWSTLSQWYISIASLSSILKPLHVMTCSLSTRFTLPNTVTLLETSSRSASGLFMTCSFNATFITLVPSSVHFC